MTHPVARQMALETELLGKAQQIAALLKTPLSEQRSHAISRIWATIARSYGPYQTGNAAIYAAPPTPHDLIVPRRDLMGHGAYRASLWSSIAHLLERQTEVVWAPLITTPQIRNVSRRNDLMSYLTQALHQLANPAALDTSVAQENQHLDIALSGGLFVNLMQAAYRAALAQGRHGPMRFLDVGCGGGTKLVMASHFFRQADGLEYNSVFAENARRTLHITKTEGASVIEDDALRFENYADYDVIYFYRPISNDALLAKMEKTIVDQATPKTIIIAPMELTLSTTLADRVPPLGRGRLFGTHPPRRGRVDQIQSRGHWARLVSRKSRSRPRIWVLAADHPSIPQ